MADRAPVLYDCDPGVDDAIALLLLLASPGVELLGVSTVAGNQTLDKTTANAIRVLEAVGHGAVPVAAGAAAPLTRSLQVAEDVHGRSGLGGARLPPPGRAPAAEHAIDAMARAVVAHGAAVTLIATGPLTNVALLLARYPELAERLGRIVVMGGAIGLGNVTPAAEFNVWIDPEAAQRVFSSGVPLTMVGLDVTHRALIGATHVRQLGGAGAAGRLVAELYGFYAEHHRRRYGWSGAPVHDAVAVAAVTDPGVVRLRRCGVLVDTGPEPSRGRTYVDLWGAAGWPVNCEVAVEIDAESFLALLVERISGLG